MERQSPPPRRRKHGGAGVNQEGQRQETRVNIGVAFPRWTSLKRDKCFQSDAEVACFLLDSYERGASASTHMNGKVSDVTGPAVPGIGASSEMDSLHDMVPKITSGAEIPRLTSLGADEHRGPGLVPPEPAPATEMVQTQVRIGLHVQQLLPVKEEVPWSSILDQQGPDLHHTNEEQEELLISQEGEQLNALEEADIARFPISSVPVKTEDDEEKSDSSQLHLRPAEDNREAEPPSSCLDKQIKSETYGEDCGGPELSRNPDLQPSTDEKASDSHEAEVSVSDELQKPETADSDSGWTERRALESGVNINVGFNTTNTSFSCSDCGKHLFYRQSLQRHMTSQLGKKTNKKGFKVKQNADSPMAGHTEEKPFGCDVCGQRFKREANLKTHIRVHTGEKPFSCNVCEKRFRHQYNLYRHMRIHTGEKPFGCGVCNKRFSQLWDLKRHKSVHTGEKPFNCSVCGKKFTQRMHFKRHMRVHTGERPFGCDVCGKGFNCKRNLKTHIRVHTGERPFGCDVCNKWFSQPGILKRHMNVHTGVKSLRPGEPRHLGLVTPIPEPAVSELVQTQVSSGVDVQQMLLIKEEVPSSPSLDQQDPDLHRIKEEQEEQEELSTCLEGEQVNGLEEADVTKFPAAAVPVKSEDDGEKPDSSQLHQRPTEDSSDSEPPTSCSAKQIKEETDGEDYGGPDPDRNHLQPNTDGKASDSYETEVSIDDDDDWQEPLTDSGSETEDSDSSWKDSGALDSGVNSDVGSNTAKKYLSCSECGKQFDCKRSLQRHVTSSSGKRSSCCLDNKKCFEVNQTAGGLHTEEKPFGCDICGQRFNQNAHLKTHIRIHTGEKPFRCNICEKIFRHQYNLNRHMRVHTGEKPFSCVVCGQKFNRNTNLKTHMRIHTGEKPFGCGLCSKRFSQPGDLKRHRSVHTGEKPFKCSICGKRFTQRIHYKTHMSVHTGERPFVCDLCGKTFNREGNLKIHKRVHTGEKPFGCDICGQRFNQSTNLKTHMRVHSGEKPFCCTVCGERFTREGSLRRHMKRQGINHSMVVKELDDNVMMQINHEVG